MTSVKAAIEHLLTYAFKPQELHIIDDSKRHQGHKEAGEETHFTISIVSVAFENKTIIQRHRLVHNALKELLPSRIHALSLNLKTPQEGGEIISHS